MNNLAPNPTVIELVKEMHAVATDDMSRRYGAKAVVELLQIAREDRDAMDLPEPYPIGIIRVSGSTARLFRTIIGIVDPR